MMYFSRVRIRPEIFRSTQLAKVLADSSYNIHRMLWDLFPREKERNFLYREEIAREQFGSAAGVRGEPVYFLVSSAKPFEGSPIFDVEPREYQPKLREGDRLSFELRANPVVTQKIERENPDHYLRERKHRPVADKNKLTKKRVRHDIVMDAQKTFLSSLCEKHNLQSHLSAVPKKREFKDVLLAHGGYSLDEYLTKILENDCRYANRLRHPMRLHEKLEWSLKATIDDALNKWMAKQGERHGFNLAVDEYDQCKLQNSAYRWHALTKKADKGEKPGFSSVDFTGELEVGDPNLFIDVLYNGVGPAKAFGCGLMLVKRI
jgi:CRISPR system Cascade subunit CasE